jgi:hypothetical protein
LVKGVRQTISAPFFGPEEEGFGFVLVINIGNVDGAAEGKSEIVLMIRRRNALFIPRRRVEHVVADKFIGVAVESVGPRFGFDLDCAGAVLAILRAVIGSENFEFADGIDAGGYVERVILPVIHDRRAIEFPIVVFAATAVDAVEIVGGNADAAFIGSGLIADSGNERDQLFEVSAIEFELRNLSAGDGTAEIGGLGFYLRDRCSLNHDFYAGLADLHGYIHARFFRHAKDDAFGLVLLEAGRGYRDVIAADGKGGEEIVAAAVGRSCSI